MDAKAQSRTASTRDAGEAAVGSFALEVEATTLVCPTGERYADERIREGSIPVLSCEGPCIRGEIARQAANRVARQGRFARACQGETMTVPHSGMARWVREAERVVVVDGCFLRCQARQMRSMLRPGQLVSIDVLPFYQKYTDKFDIDDVPEPERNALAEEIAGRIVAQLVPVSDPAARDRLRSHERAF